MDAVTHARGIGLVSPPNRQILQYIGRSLGVFLLSWAVAAVTFAVVFIGVGHKPFALAGGVILGLLTMSACYVDRAFQADCETREGLFPMRSSAAAESALQIENPGEFQRIAQVAALQYALLIKVREASEFAEWLYEHDAVASRCVLFIEPVAVRQAEAFESRVRPTSSSETIILTGLSREFPQDVLKSILMLFPAYQIAIEIVTKLRGEMEVAPHPVTQDEVADFEAVVA